MTTEPGRGRLAPALRDRVAPLLRGRIGVAVAVVAGALLLSGCQAPTFGAFRGATTQGQATFKLWVFFCVAGLAVSVLVWGLIFWTVAFHRRKNEEIPRQFSESIPIEITYTIIPIILVLVLFYFTVVTENQVDAVSDHPAYVVDVNAFQWGWQFRYHGYNVTIQTSEEPGSAAYAAVPTDPRYPRLMLPEGVTTRIVLQSNDVAHSLWVPAFNFSRMALPGHINQFDFTPVQLGLFDGRCNQYCGLYHSEMLFSVKVVTLSQFKSWLATEAAAQGGGGANT